MPKKSLLIQCALLVLLTLVLLWSVPVTADQHQPAAAVKNIYVCGCGPAANCNAIANQPGKAPCGKPLIEKQVLREDADKIYVCACADDCKCSLNVNEPSKCACGKELRAYPKTGEMGCAHGMPMGGGCDKHCDSCPKKANCAGCPNMPAAAK